MEISQKLNEILLKNIPNFLMVILDFHLKFSFDRNESEKEQEEVVENLITIWGQNEKWGIHIVEIKIINLYKHWRECTVHSLTEKRYLSYVRVNYWNASPSVCVCVCVCVCARAYTMYQEWTLCMFYTCEVRTFDQEQTHSRSSVSFSLRLGLIIIDHKNMG